MGTSPHSRSQPLASAPLPHRGSPSRHGSRGPRSAPQRPRPRRRATWSGSRPAPSSWAAMTHATPRPSTRGDPMRVDGFWMDEHHVTNAQFRNFVEATGYVTTAERKPDWEELKKQLPPGTPKPTDNVLVAGSLVFTPPSGRVQLIDDARVVAFVARRRLAAPRGPGSTHRRQGRPSGRAHFLDDALAYCNGPANGCPPRPNGNTRRAAASTPSATSGATRMPRQAAHGEHLAGRFPARTPPTTASPAPRR